MFICSLEKNFNVMYYRVYNSRKLLALKFISWSDKNLRDKIIPFDYLCDIEFLNYLLTLSNLKLETENVRNYKVVLDILPEEILTLAKMYRYDMCEVFKIYMNMPKLDKLYKGN